MSALARPKMNVDEFLVWAEEQDEDERWELVDGVPTKLMSPQRRIHGRVKALVWQAFSSAIARSGLPCEAILDSLGLRIDDENVRIPDLSVECGPSDDDDLWLDAPIILVEVVSPGSVRRDGKDKLIDYFRVGSVAHYLVVFPKDGVVVHHRRAAGSTDISTRILSGGTVDLDPPGLSVAIADFFRHPGADAADA